MWMFQINSLVKKPPPHFFFSLPPPRFGPSSWELFFRFLLLLRIRNLMVISALFFGGSRIRLHFLTVVTWRDMGTLKRRTVAIKKHPWDSRKLWKISNEALLLISFCFSIVIYHLYIRKRAKCGHVGVEETLPKTWNFDWASASDPMEIIVYLSSLSASSSASWFWGSTFWSLRVELWFWPLTNEVFF